MAKHPEVPQDRVSSQLIAQIHGRWWASSATIHQHAQMREHRDGSYPPTVAASLDYRENCKSCDLPAQATDWIYVDGYPPLKR